MRLLEAQLLLLGSASAGSAVSCDASGFFPHTGSGQTAFQKTNASSAAVCCADCAAAPQCGYFTWDASQVAAGDACHLKTGSPAGKTNKCDTCTTSGLAPTPPTPPAPTPTPATTPPIPTPPPSPAPAGAPNLLLLFPDQWRFDWDGVTPQTSHVPGAMLRVPAVRAAAAQGTRFTSAYVPAPVCAPSRSCLASGREYDDQAATAGVPSNGHDYGVNTTTFYAVLRAGGYHVMTTGKDDLTKASQLGSKTGYPGCPGCVAGDGRYHLAELGFSDALRYSGKMDVVQQPTPHEMYGFYLANHSMALAGGENVTGWEAHRACMGKASALDCASTTFTPELYEDDFTAANALALLRRKPDDGKPWFLHVSFPGPHDPFLVTTDMRNAASDGRAWPGGVDNPGNNTPGGACAPVDAPTGTRNRCNYAAEIENLDRLFTVVLAEVAARGDAPNTVVCMASDHGEMLGDHGDVDKSKPWEGSAHVPLVCFGPGIASGAEVGVPVATMDLAGTFLDYAGAAPAPGMTTRSLRPLLESGGGAAALAAYRGHVSSGLANFRLVVAQQPKVGGAAGAGETTQYKYICCKGPCPNAPSTAPQPKGKDDFVEMLVDPLQDPYDMHDLAPDKAYAAVVERMRALLPPAYAAGCANATRKEN